MYKIEGKSNNVVVTKDGEEVPYETLDIIINQDHSVCLIDFEKEGSISFINITGLFNIIGSGEFTNTRIFYLDELVRGVQEIYIMIKKGTHPILELTTVLMPNLVEGVNDGKGI